jgi:hypothetical protein
MVPRIAIWIGSMLIAAPLTADESEPSDMHLKIVGGAQVAAVDSSRRPALSAA